MEENKASSHSYKFPKSQRLNSKKVISNLFKRGRTIFVYPFLVKYLEQDGLETHEVLISVSKKKHKRAHDRNLIKRRIREAYRLNRAHFNFKSTFSLAYIYSADRILSFGEIEEKLKETLLRLSTIQNPDK